VLTLSEDIEEFRRAVQARAAADIAPLAAQIDREQRFSPRLWEITREMNLTGLPFAEAIGGQGGTYLAYVTAIEEVARAAAISGLYPGTTVQVARVLEQLGTPEQRDRWLEPLVRGDAIGCWAFTEPSTGSDPKQIRTRVREDGDGWLLSGQKAFITHAATANVALTFAQMPGGRIGAFLVDTSDPGWQPGEHVDLLCLGGAGTATVYIDDVRLGPEALVGAPGEGFQVMLAGEAEGKVRTAAICVGIAQRAVDEAAKYARERLHRGTPIGDKFPTVQALLGGMQAQVVAARALVRAVAQEIDEGREVQQAAAAARLMAARASREVSSDALQVCGAYGLTRDLPVERLYREGKFFEVGQGVAEIQRIIIGKRVLAAR